MFSVGIILTVLNYIFIKILKKKELGESQPEIQRLPIEKELAYAEKYIKHFFDIFAKNR